MLPLTEQVPSCDWTDAFTNLGIQDVVERLFRSQGKPPRHERRKDKRIPFPHLLTLTPLAEKQHRTIGEPVTVVGKYLAARGLDFYHHDTLPYKRAVVSFDHGSGEGIHLVLRISWCRFLRPSWYDSGGRFTHIVQPERSQVADATT